MPFIPHTESDIRAMLKAIGVESLDDLFDEIPAPLRSGLDGSLAPACNELGITRLMQDRARADGEGLCFIGAGAYEHHIPAPVWEIASRGEFYSAYTPYQAEASQGTLQLLYEYQSMMAGLMGLAVSNASLYDGASALAEALLMAVRCNRRSRSRRILMPATVNPSYRRVAETIVRHQGLELVALPFDPETGTLAPALLEAYQGEDITALVIPQPNFFGNLEPVDELTDWAHAHGALAIGLVNPLACALLKPPGEWGGNGVDIACGEGQPLGIPLSSGGPYFGFLCCRREHLRQMPGRIAGATVDTAGQRAYTLTLQAREQHIRRSKATSNICTNQGLMVTAATLHMALLGAEGLRRVAQHCHQNTRALVQRLTRLEGVDAVFPGPFFHEAVLRLSEPTAMVLARLAQENLLGGWALNDDFPELGECLLVCATETRSAEDFETYARLLAEILQPEASL